MCTCCELGFPQCLLDLELGHRLKPNLIPWGTLSAELEREEEQEEEAAAAAAEEEEAIAEEVIVTTTITTAATAAATKVYEERILSTKNNTPVKPCTATDLAQILAV